MAKWNKLVKIMAILALFGIIIWIVWTGLLIIFDNNQSYQPEQTISPEEKLKLQELIKANSWTTIKTGTWVDSFSGTWNIDTNIWNGSNIESGTWEIE